jgi:hypothetical protein
MLKKGGTAGDAQRKWCRIDVIRGMARVAFFYTLPGATLDGLLLYGSRMEAWKHGWMSSRNHVSWSGLREVFARHRAGVVTDGGAG